MAQAQDATEYIYEGFWMNWSKTGSHGLTLTLCPTTATLLTNSLALFITMSGGQLWTIFRFVLHQIQASSKSQTHSMSHNQEQVILRNATTDIATVRLLITLAWQSRKNKLNKDVLFSKSKAIVLLAIAHAVFFVLAGAFSNKLASAGPTVLSISPYCGDWNETYLAIAGFGPNAADDESLHLSVQYTAKEVHEYQLSLEYAKDCYLSESPILSLASCDTFAQPALNWTMFSKDTCPFNSTVCHETAPTIVFDTHYIDSHKDLGINAHLDERIYYRRVTNCSVLNDKAYTTDWITTQNGFTGVESPWNVSYAKYGPSYLEESPFTYSYSDFAQYYSNFSAQSTLSYQINAQVAFGLTPYTFSNPSIPTFEPIEELAQSEADLFLLFLSFTGRYLDPIDDPWFAAHQLLKTDSRAVIARTQYLRDRPISTVGCTEQHDFCTQDGKCTGPMGFDQVQAITSTWALSPKQNVTLNRILEAVAISSTRQVVEGLAFTSAPMLAITETATEMNTLSMKLPDNQWQRELNNWHAISMAHLQRTMVEYGTGQIAPDTKFLIRPQNDEQSWLCQNATIQSTAYQSFSALALGLMLAFGLLTIIVSWTIEPLARRIQHRFFGGAGDFGRDMWAQNDMLTLAREVWKTHFVRRYLPSDKRSPVVDSTAKVKFEKDIEQCVKPPRIQIPGLQVPEVMYGGPRSPGGSFIDSLRRASSSVLSPGEGARLWLSRAFGRSSASGSSPRSEIYFTVRPPTLMVYEDGDEKHPIPSYPVDEKFDPYADDKPLPDVPARSPARGKLAKLPGWPLPNPTPSSGSPNSHQDAGSEIHLLGRRGSVRTGQFTTQMNRFTAARQLANPSAAPAPTGHKLRPASLATHQENDRQMEKGDIWI